MSQQRSSYDHLQEGVRSFKAPAIEVWENKYRDRAYTVAITIPEFTSLCPKTGLPDFAVISIEYMPDKWCVELKSFKLYMVSYRNRGIFMEHAVNRIFDDFLAVCKPRWAKIVGDYNPRGGMGTKVEREYRGAKKSVKKIKY
jgi:7-cyano-7-deazaguanine reductase